MRTKTQNIAMFAVAAFAIVGMAGVTAFAAEYAFASLTAGSGHTVSGTDTISCGSGQCMAKIESHTTEDWIKYYYGTIGGNSCDVVSIVAGAGPIHNHNHGAGSGIASHNYTASVNQNATISVTNVYSNCT